MFSSCSVYFLRCLVSHSNAKTLNHKWQKQWWGGAIHGYKKHASNVHLVLKHPFPTRCTSGAWHLFSSSLLPWAFQAADGWVKPKIWLLCSLWRGLPHSNWKILINIIRDGCISVKKTTEQMKEFSLKNHRIPSKTQIKCLVHCCFRVYDQTRNDPIYGDPTFCVWSGVLDDFDRSGAMLTAIKKGFAKDGPARLPR